MLLINLNTVLSTGKHNLITPKIQLGYLWFSAEFRHNKIVQSPHKYYFKVFREHKEKRALMNIGILIYYPATILSQLITVTSFKINLMRFMQLSVLSKTISPAQTPEIGLEVCKKLPSGQNRESKALPLGHKVRKFHKCIHKL